MGRKKNEKILWQLKKNLVMRVLKKRRNDYEATLYKKLT
jgi:hypothetical protein